MNFIIKKLCTLILLLMFVGNTLPMSCITMELRALFSSMQEDHSCCVNQSQQDPTSQTDSSNDQHPDSIEICDCSDHIYLHTDYLVESPVVLPLINFVKDHYLLQLQKYSLAKEHDGPPILSRDFQQIENKQSFLI